MITKQPQSAIVTAGTSVNGTMRQQAAQVFNSASGDKELIFTIANSGTVGNSAHDTNNFSLFPGGWRPILALDARTTFTSEYFTSYEEMQRYFQGVSCNIAGVRMETSNTDNYESQIIRIEKDPTGEDKKVRLNLSTLKVPLGGGGYNSNLTVPAEKFSPVTWNGLQIDFTKIKAGSSITFYMKVVGWDKMRSLSALSETFL